MIALIDGILERRSVFSRKKTYKTQAFSTVGSCYRPTSGTLMTLTVLIVIVAIATLFLALRWHRTSRVLYGVSLVLFLASGGGWVPQWLLQNLQSHYSANASIEWGDKDAIVLLGAGTARIPQSDGVEPGMFAYARILGAGELYQDCRKSTTHCTIIVSGGDSVRHGVSEAAVYRDVLVRLGVPNDDIVVESKSLNTYQNAQLTSEILKAYVGGRVLLVSSGFHLRRSALYFEHFGVTTTPVRADYLDAKHTVLPSAYNFTVMDVALNEYIGILRYRAYNRLGWNSRRKVPPGLIQ